MTLLRHHKTEMPRDCPHGIAAHTLHDPVGLLTSIPGIICMTSQNNTQTRTSSSTRLMMLPDRLH